MDRSVMGVGSGVALGCVVLLVAATPLAEAKGSSGDASRLLSSGSVWEDVNAVGRDGDWHIQFAIYSDAGDKRGHVRVQAEGRKGPALTTFAFDTSICTGYLDTKLDTGESGVTTYAVGHLTQGTPPPPRFTGDLVGFWAFDGGKGGQDYSWVVPVANEAQADAFCAHPETVFSDRKYEVVGGNIVFKGR